MKRVIPPFLSIEFNELFGTVIVLAISISMSCGGGSDGACIAFETAACQCLQGTGEMVCLADGSGYGDCICSPLTNSGAGVEAIESGSGGNASVLGGVGGDRTADVGGASSGSPSSGAGGAPVAGTGGAPVAGTGGVPNSGTGGESDGGTSGEPVGGTGGEPVGGTGGEELPLFSFFVTSLEAIQRLSNSPNGFGGDLRYGEADGLAGADKICTEIAEYSMPGASAKQWRAFLSTTTGGPDGGPVHAIERVGTGPWYDRLGRLVAETTTALANTRPEGAESEIVNDLPNEYGVPNHAPDGEVVDNHDILTGSNAEGKLYGDAQSTCQDWTSSVATDGTPRCGHSWPRGGGWSGRPGGGRPGGDGMGGMDHWISALDEAGCAPGVSIIEMGGPNPLNPTVGSGGGYGGFYCFALTP